MKREPCHTWHERHTAVLAIERLMSTIPIDPSHISDDRLGDRGADDTRVFTIGHSNHSLERSLALLAKHRITAVADVRPEPYSRFRPHFSRDALAAGLKAHGIDYAFLGREFGGRPADSDCYRDGRVDYERVARTSGFRDGVAWVIDRAARDRIALICAEKEPLDCHRTLLVARALDEAGVAVVHILADGALEPHGRTMDRLMAAFDRPAPDLHRLHRNPACCLTQISTRSETDASAKYPHERGAAVKGGGGRGGGDAPCGYVDNPQRSQRVHVIHAAQAAAEHPALGRWAENGIEKPP